MIEIFQKLMKDIESQIWDTIQTPKNKYKEIPT